MQSAHAAIEFTLRHPDLVPETLVLCAAPDEMALWWLLGNAHQDGCIAVAFHEPDLGGQLTAVALEPAGHHLARRFPLAYFREGGELDDDYRHPPGPGGRPSQAGR